MSTQRMRGFAQQDRVRRSGSSIRNAVHALAVAGALAAAGLVAGRSEVAAQAPLGVPFIGDNHLSFYTTELTTDGVTAGMSTLYGGRYAHRFGEPASRTRLSVAVQGAAWALDDPDSGVLDVSVVAGWTRRLDDVVPRLSATASVGASALLWGKEHSGLAHVSVPIATGVAYDLRIGGVTLTPFVSPGVAYFSSRRYVDDVRVSTENDWDVRFTAGTSLRLKELVLTTSRIRGENSLPHSSRWAFSAGISF